MPQESARIRFLISFARGSLQQKQKKRDPIDITDTRQGRAKMSTKNCNSLPVCVCLELGLGLAFLGGQDPQVLLQDLARSRFGDRVEDKDAAAEPLVVRELLLDVLGDILLQSR